jgi:hypothetical protein
MIAELGFDRTLHGVDVGTEHDLIEFPDHHPRSELAQVSAISPGRA